MTFTASTIIFSLLASSTIDATGALSLHRTGIHHRTIGNVVPTRQTPFTSRTKERKATSTTSFAIPDVSSLMTDPSYELATTNSAPLVSPQTFAAFASATLTYISLLAYFDRPRGSISIPDIQNTLLIQQSRVPNAGLGLFVTQSLPKGTVLGTYAGVIRPAQTFYDGKCRQFPQAVGYSWRFTDNRYIIDPTDSQGEIQDFCLGGSSEVPLSNVIFKYLLGFWGVNTALCRINEPPIGVGGCNVNARENLETREVMFELVQDVVAGQELYLDYGLDYDRSRYGPMPGSDN